MILGTDKAVMMDRLDDALPWDEALVGLTGASFLGPAMMLLKEMRARGIRAGPEAREAVLEEAARVGDPRPSVFLLGKDSFGYRSSMEDVFAKNHYKVL